MTDDVLRTRPRDARNFHRRQASHLRALAASTTTHAVRDRLLNEAEQHENLVEIAGDPSLEEIVAGV